MIDLKVETRRGDRDDRRLVIVLVFIVILLGLVSSVVLLAFGRTGVAGAVGGASGLLALASGLIYQQRRRKTSDGDEPP